ncbi:MAG: hypothetical protein J6X70_00185 [Muribaculaceae bacterium]|nr:hypothetical protein [Muribaculaceae bacterium]
MKELDIIAHVRNEVATRKELTGENLFLAWGYPTAIVLLLEFVALLVWDENWCAWLWGGIPLMGVPLLVYFLKKDYKRTGRMTLDQNVILQMWIFVGCVCCVDGIATGFAGVFMQCFFPFLGLLCGMGCFLTGVILRFRPKTMFGIMATALSFVTYFFQGEMWHWQLLLTAMVIVVCLIIPGHLYRRHVKRFTAGEKEKE